MKIMVEKADTPEKREKGLMNRASLPAGHGMLFVYEDDGPRSFWMKNTSIPLDICFLDGDMKVRSVGRGIPHSLKDVTGTGRYVLEVNHGEAPEVGETVECSAESAEKMAQDIRTSLAERLAPYYPEYKGGLPKMVERAQNNWRKTKGTFRMPFEPNLEDLTSPARIERLNWNPLSGVEGSFQPYTGRIRVQNTGLFKGPDDRTVLHELTHKAQYSDEGRAAAKEYEDSIQDMRQVYDKVQSTMTPTRSDQEGLEKALALLDNSFERVDRHASKYQLIRRFLDARFPVKNKYQPHPWVPDFLEPTKAISLPYLTEKGEIGARLSEAKREWEKAFPDQPVDSPEMARKALQWFIHDSKEYGTRESTRKELELLEKALQAPESLYKIMPTLHTLLENRTAGAAEKMAQMYKYSQNTFRWNAREGGADA
jgi:uncharacterized membrane protein (UPF0127 family)